jgi:hypothetical protein
MTARCGRLQSLISTTARDRGAKDLAAAPKKKVCYILDSCQRLSIKR